jgi:hypothetical protein
MELSPMGIKTPFSDAIVKKVPTSPSKGGATSEPNLPGNCPGRDGGGLPEVHRDGTIAKKPSFKMPGETFWYGR